MMQNKFLSRINIFASTLWVIIPCCLQAAWTTPVQINQTMVDQPYIAVDRSGNAIAVWQGYDGSNNVIQAASMPFLGKWGAIQTISPAGYNAQGPCVAVDKNGNAVCVWSYYDGINSRIQGAQLPYGGSWGSTALISGAGQNADTPHLSMDSTGNSGNAIAVWHRYNGSNFIAQASVLPSGGNWSTPVDVSPSGEDALSPNVDVDPNGNAVVTCLRSSPSGFNTRSCTLLEGQNWSPSYDISSEGEPSGLGTVAVDYNGNAVATWNEWDGFNYRIYVSKLPYGGSWSTATPISSSGRDAFSPVVTIDGNGTAFVAWVIFDGTSYRLQVSRKTLLGGWSSPQTISSSGNNVNNIDIASNGLGMIVLAWDITDGVNSWVESSFYLSSLLGWGTVKKVSSSGSYAYYPSVDMDSLGNVVLLWLGSTESGMGLWSSNLLIGL